VEGAWAINPSQKSLLAFLSEQLNATVKVCSRTPGSILNRAVSCHGLSISCWILSSSMCVPPSNLAFREIWFCTMIFLNKKSIIFWDMTSCSLVEIFQRLGWKLFLQLQVLRMWREKKQENREIPYCFLSLSTYHYNPEDDCSNSFCSVGKLVWRYIPGGNTFAFEFGYLHVLKFLFCWNFCAQKCNNNHTRLETHENPLLKKLLLREENRQLKINWPIDLIWGIGDSPLDDSPSRYCNNHNISL
jgi:hypothetical protein